MDLAQELHACLKNLFAPGAVEIREPAGRTTPATPLSWEVRGATDKPLLHLWAENCNVTRRVLAIADQSDSRLSLSVERFGRAAPERLDIVRLDFPPNPKQVSRQDFCEQLRRILAEQFPDETLEKLSIAADLEHTLSRIFARGVTRKGQTRGAFLAVPERETQDAIESSLTYALLWLERARQFAGRPNGWFLRLIVPQGKATLLVHQLAALDPRLAIQIYELNSQSETMERVDPCANGNIQSWLVPLRECQLLLDRAKDDLAPIIATAPEAICAHPIPRDHEVLLRFRGLPFARWRDGRIDFAAGSLWQELRPRTEHELHQLILNLKNFRNPVASALRHPLYRAQPERWMQTIVIQDLSRVDILLSPQHVYEQVIAKSHGQHGILDLLAVTNTKRLAILELKAGENPELPLQAADYWDRIRRLHAQGDLARYGYFAGLQLQPDPPIVYLLAPALRFHPTTETILRYLSPELQVIRLGLAENWRRGLRVVMRQ